MISLSQVEVQVVKYGLIVYKDTHGGHTQRKDEALFNVGDNIQMKAMARIYTEEMRIPPTDIVKIDFHELDTYKGEPVILPVNLYFFGCGDGRTRWFPASPCIIPVFISVHFSANYLRQEEIDYLRTYAPIGCRDEYTLQTMRKYGIPAYLFGCITATLPKREENACRNKIYCVDAPDEALQYLPESVHSDIEYKCHVVRGFYSSEMFLRMDQMAEQLLREYCAQAALVVTSRLHCAAPCMAMGIPVVLAAEELSSRFSWIDRLLPVYTKERFSEICWNPKPVEYEYTKNKMIQLVVKRLQDAMAYWGNMTDISYFFESRTKTAYVDPFQKMIQSADREIFKNGNESYIIWGNTCAAEQIYQHICEKYPHANLEAVIDEYNSSFFHEYQTVKFSDLSDFRRGGGQSISIIATPASAKEAILQRLKEADNHVICVFLDGDSIRT